MSHVPCIARAVRLTVASLVAFALAAGAAAATDHVVFVTDYGLYGRHAYYFVAMEKGYYAAENLDIEIVRSQGSANTIKQVANGTAQLSGTAELNPATGAARGNFTLDGTLTY